jgi:hypothetical protein
MKMLKHVHVLQLMDFIQIFFQNHVGLMPGEVISPILFAIYMYVNDSEM